MSSTNLEPLPEVRLSNHDLGLFALQDYAHGATILDLNPPSCFMALNDQYTNPDPEQRSMRTTCYSCFKRTEADQPIACSGCPFVRFCGKNCAASDRTRHEIECSSFQRLHHMVDSNLRYSGMTDMLAILRLVSLKDAGLIPRFWDDVIGLHANDASNYSSPKRFRLGVAAQVIKDASQTGIDLSVIRRLFDVINTNCFGLFASDNKQVGFQVFPLLSRANHDCNANMAYTAGMKRVAAAKPIRAGDELTTSYVDVNLDVMQRQKKLKEGYFFDCNCERCRAELQAIAMQEAQKDKGDT